MGRENIPISLVIMILQRILICVLANMNFQDVRAYVAFNSMPVATTRFTNVYGKYQLFGSKPVAAFLGVPYAEPPLGPLRYRRPVPVKEWTTPIYALEDKPACMQSQTVPITWADLQPGKSEDCLYLNIWVPESDAFSGLMPVMFYIHGGGFFVGSSRLDVYNGRVLAALGDVIVVTINYRLGSFGYLYSGSSDAPGNAGFYDVAEALRWVNGNIHYFGGNKHQITVFGQSVGGVQSGAVGISPLTRSLFKRMILQSGSPTILTTLHGLSLNSNISITLAKEVGCYPKDSSVAVEPKSMVECLRGVDAQFLSIVDANIVTRIQPTYRYQYPDEILPINPLEAVLAGDIKDCEVLIGITKDEGSNILTFDFPEYFGPFGDKSSKLTKSRGREMLRQAFAIIEEVDEIADYYYANIGDNDYERITIQTYKAFEDTIFRCPAKYFAEKMAERNNVYFYTFEHRSSQSPYAEWMGVPHFEEIAFVFGQPLREPEKYSRSEQILSREMVKIWTSFAKTGKPELSFGNWPSYLRYSPKYVILNTTLDNQVRFGPGEEECNFIRTIYKIT